jgi:hypothetical protein
MIEPINVSMLMVVLVAAKRTTIPASTPGTAPIRIQSGDALQARVIIACRALLRVLISSYGEIAAVSELKIGNKPLPRA